MENNKEKQKNQVNVKAPEKEEEKKTEEKKVEIKKTDQKDVEKEALKQKVAELEEQMKTVLSVVDQSRLEYFKKAKEVKGPNMYKVSVIDDKIVLGWKMLKDEVYQDPVSHIFRVNQAYQFLLEDGSTKEISGYNNFASMQYNNQIEAQEVSRSIDSNGTVLTLKTVDGKEFKIDIRFVN